MVRADAGSSGAGGVPIRVPKTAEIVADHIRARIIRGELQEGDFLPPEGQLMGSLSISRPTLREAFRVLEAEQLISIVRGSRSGARVHRPTVDNVSRHAGYVLQSQDTTVKDIYEARLAIEPFVVRRLAERRGSQAAARLRDEVQILTDLVEGQRYTDFMIGLARFHRVLVELSGNRTLLFVTRMLQDVLERYQVHFIQVHRLSVDEQRRVGLAGIRSFNKLIDLIEAGDQDRAEAHWRLHLTNANTAWVPKGEDDVVIDVLS